MTAYAADAGISDLRTLALGFREFEGTPEDELPLAEETARLYRTRHFAGRMGLDGVKKELPNFFKAMDQPSIDGLNTYLVSKMAADQKLKVVLSGIGSDEIFGGYPSFADVPSWVRALTPRATTASGSIRSRATVQPAGFLASSMRAGRVRPPSPSGIDA